MAGSLVAEVTSWEARGCWALAEGAESCALVEVERAPEVRRRRLDVTKLNSEHETLKRKRKEIKFDETRWYFFSSWLSSSMRAG